METIPCDQWGEFPPGDVIEPRSAQLSPVASPVQMLTARTPLSVLTPLPQG